MKPEILSALNALEAEPTRTDVMAQLAAALAGGERGDPSVQRALAEARRVHRERGEYELVLRLLDLQLEGEKDAARTADLVYEKGRLLVDDLWQEEEAERCFSQVLELRPGDAPASDALAQLGLVRENWKKVLKKYREEARSSTDRQLTSSLHVSIAELFAKHQPGSPDEEVALRRALEVEPRNRRGAVHLERMLRSEERWSDLRDYYQQRLPLAANKDEKIALSLALAELARDHLKDAALFAEMMRAVSTLDPLQPRALKALAEGYAAAGDWQDLLKLYEGALRMRPRSELEHSLLAELGRVWWRHLGDLDKAEEYFRRVRQKEPGSRAALDFYRAYYGERGEGQKLLQLLAQAQKSESDEHQRLRLAVEMARLAETAAGSPEKAIDIWKSVARLDRTNADAVAALRRLYERTEKWNGLLELLKEQVEILPKEPAYLGERIQRLLEIVSIYRDKLKLDAMEINTYNTILQLQPDHQGALAALAAKYEAMGRWNDLIGVLQRQAEVEPAAEEKARLLRRVATLWVEKFGNHNQAVKPLEQLYVLQPGDEDVVKRLRDIYVKRRTWAALLGLEQRELECLEGAPRRAKLVEMARLAAERVGDFREAISLWNRLLEDDPQDGEALAALAGLYEREKRYAALAEVMRRQRQRLQDPKLVVPLLEKLGALWSDKLGMPAKGIETLREILKVAPGHAKTMRSLRELFALTGDLSSLEALYAEQGHWDELCETLLAIAERSSDTAIKLKLYFRVAEVALGKSQQIERAAKAYERVLALEPHHPEAARGLVPIYQRSEKWARLLAVYEILLDDTKEDTARLALLERIRELCEDKLGSKQLAFTWCARAFALRGDDPQLEAELERLAKEADAHEELAQIYDQQLRGLPSGELRMRRLRQLGTLYLGKLKQPEQARECFAQVLAETPGDAEALAALEQIHTQAERWPELRQVVQQRLEVTRDAGVRAELLAKIAWIEEEKSGNLEEAARSWERILDENVMSIKALRALERIYGARQQWEGLAQVLGRQLELVGDDFDAEVEIACRLGELFEHRLGQPAIALDHYRRAFARQPSHRATLAALERALAPGNAARVEVARLLAPHYEKSEEQQRLAEALAILLEAAADREAELGLLRRLVTLVGHRLGDAEGAFGYALRLFEHVPEDVDNRRELVDLADLLDRHDALVEKLGAAEERVAAGHPELARDLAWERAGLLEQRLHQTEEAEQAYQRVLARDGLHAGAFRALERLYRAGERFVELRQLFEQRQARTLEASERRDLLLQMCDLDEGVLEDETAACRSYRQVLEIDPASPRAFKALERILSGREQWKDLDDLWARISPHLEQAEEQAQLLARRAELRATRLDDVHGACDLFEEALGQDHRNELARKGLEKLITRPELRQRVAHLLEPLYTAERAWPKLVSTLAAQREVADGPAAMALLARMAQLVEERIGSRQQAFQLWREALLLDPADETARRQVERLAVVLERHADLAAAWEEAERHAPTHDLALRADLLRRAATLYDEQLEEASRARLVWRRLLDLDPANLETAKPAVAALERLYQAQEAWPELIEMLRRQAEWAEVVEEKKDLLRRVALIQEDVIQDFDGAAATHRAILDFDSEDGDAIDALERLHLAQERWDDLVGILRRRLSLAVDAAVRRDLEWRIAVLTEQKLGLPPASPEIISTYQAVLDEHPDDLPALGALSRLFDEAKRPRELMDVLERRLALAGPPGERVALRARMAALLEGPIGSKAQALDRYREMLIDDPDNAAARQGLERMLEEAALRLQAAEVLEPIYEGSGDHARLIQLCELWAEHASDPRDRIARLKRIAALRLQAGELQPAFHALARAARIAAADAELPSLLASLEQIAAKGKLQASLIALYRELGAEILDPALQERVYLTVAAEARKLGDRATAREFYRRVLDAVPDHAGALAALEALYAEGGEHQALLEIYSRRAELAADDDEARRRYLRLAAQLCEKELARSSEAIVCYEQIIELFPVDGDAAQALDALYLANGRFADLAELLERRLGFADDVAQAVAMHFRLGEIYEKSLGDRERALENYRAALTNQPEHAASIAALERFLDLPLHRAEAAEVLEPVYATRQDWRALIRIHEIRLEAAEDPAKRLALTRRIALAYEEQLEDLEAAFRWYGRVFREDPEERGVRDQLARLANILDRHADLAAIYESFLEDAYEDTPPVIEVLRTLAAIYDGRLGNVDRARACYQRLLRHDPDDAQAFHHLEAALMRAGRWRDLLEIYREAADGAVEAVRRKELLSKICRVQEASLGDTDGAISTYRAILDLDDDDGEALAALDRLYVAAERWHDLADLLQRQLESADGGARIALKLRLAGLLEKQMGDLSSAIDAYEEVLRLDANSREAITALERLVMDHDQRFRIAQILEPTYAAQDEWAKLVVIYDAELEFIDDKSRRVELLQEIARLHVERGGDRRFAFAALARAWTEEAPEGVEREEPLFLSLVDLAEVLNAWQDLVDVLLRAVEGGYDYDLAARVHARVAEIREANLDDMAGAVESWRRVVAIREDDLPAWKALERLLAALGRSAELVAVLERHAELSSDMAEQKAIAYRIAELCERTLGQPEQAIATWRQVLSIDADDRPALSAFARLYKESRSYRDLAWVYGRQIELATSPAERRPLRFALAQIFDENLGDAFEAVAVYKAALEENPLDLEVLASLARLYERESLWPDLLETLDAMTAEQPRGERADELRMKAAKVLEEKQGELELAIERYRQILDDSPDHEPARRALEGLAQREETRDAATVVLEPLYRTRGEYQPLIDLFELKLAAEHEPPTRRLLLARVAELYEAGLEDMVGAFRAWGRLLAEDASDGEALDQLERLAALRSSWGELAELYEARFEAIFDADVQRLLALKLAALYESHLHDEIRAIARYRTALDLPGDEREPLAALDRLLGRRGQLRDLAEILEREAHLVGDPQGQAQFYFRLGGLRLELGEGEGALAAFKETLERDSNHGGARAAAESLLAGEHAAAALDLLEPLFEADHDHAKRVLLAEARLRLLKDPARRAAELQRMAHIFEDDLGDRSAALDALLRALAEMPEDQTLADEADRLAPPDLLAPLTAGLERLIETGLPSHVARDLGLRVARLCEQLEETKRAETHYLAVLDLDSESGEALEALERIYRARGAVAQLAEVLVRRGELLLDLTAKKRLLVEIATLRQRQLGDEAGAVAAWQEVLAVDESDAEAMDALAALHERAGRWRELIDLLDRAFGCGDSPEEQAAIKNKIAWLYAERLDDVEHAIEAYRDLLDLAPTSLEAMQRLEDLYRRRGDWSALQEILIRRLGVVGAGAEQLPLYRQLAHLAVEHLRSPEDAVGYYHDMIELAPDDEESARELEELLHRLGKWYELVDALRHHANRCARRSDRQGEIAHLVRAAAILEEKLESPESATELLEIILERDPENVRALMSLARTYELAHDTERCHETLTRAAALAQSQEERAELEYRLGRLEEERSDPAAAEIYYRRAFESNPNHEGATQALEERARQGGSWEELARLLERKVQSRDEATRKPLLLELARLYADRLAWPEGALRALERVRALTPEDPTVLEPLADLYFQSGRLAEALAVYRGLIEQLGKGRRSKELGRLHFRIGAIAEQQGDAQLAVAQYQAANQIDAGHAPTLVALGRLYSEAGEWEKARRVYRSMLLQNLDPDAGVNKADVYFALGLIHEKVNEGGKAVGMYERGLELAPEHAGLKEALARARATR